MKLKLFGFINVFVRLHRFIINIYFGDSNVANGEQKSKYYQIIVENKQLYVWIHKLFIRLGIYDGEPVFRIRICNSYFLIR